MSCLVTEKKGSRHRGSTWVDARAGGAGVFKDRHKKGKEPSEKMMKGKKKCASVSAITWG